MSEPAPAYQFEPGSGNSQNPGDLWYRWLGRLWEAVLDLSSVPILMRFSIVVLVADAVLLLSVQQSQDALLVRVAGAGDGSGESILRLGSGV